MKEVIEALEAELKRLKKAYEVQEAREYEKRPHKQFKEGDIVTDGKEIGVVGWSENNLIGCSEDKGYMGISLITGIRGFRAPVRRDNWDLVADPYYTDTFVISIKLTGLEIEELKYSLPVGCNPNPTKTKVREVIDEIKNNQ